MQVFREDTAHVDAPRRRLYTQAELDAALLQERERLRQMVSDNTWACTFQTMGQYRRALMAALGA